MIKVSVITVCFNSEKTIEKTILSVLNQTYSNVEYIVVDGNSSDSTMDIVLEYSEKVLQGMYYGKEMRVISENDNGIYDAMNKGVYISSGSIVGIINSDDWYELDAIENVVNELGRHNSSAIFYGNMNVVDGENSYYCSGSESVNEILGGMVFGHPTCFVSAALYKRFGTFDTRYRIAADYEFLLRCYINGVDFYKIDNLIANFSLGGISSTNNLMCALETVRISMNQYGCEPSSERILDRITDTLKRGCIWSLKQKELVSLINSERCSIFGSGIWGNNIRKICMKGDIGIDFWVDNDKTKWNGVVGSPSVLERYEGTVIVASVKWNKEIINQLEGFKNSGLRIVTLDDILDMALEYVRRNNKEVDECIRMINTYRLG